MALSSLIKSILPLDSKTKEMLDLVSANFDKEDLNHLVRHLKLKDIKMEKRTPDLTVVEPKPIIEFSTNREELKEAVDKLNKKVWGAWYEILFEKFSHDALDTLPMCVAPNILGFENIKTATMLQLLSDEAIHILLIGDPGTGKTDIIRNASNFAMKNSFGLGSGTSGVGLSVAFKGSEMQKGLLPMAHEGVCGIDELNLLKQEDRASLYNAMEKGFISYSKGGQHHKIDAMVKVIATANPKGDRFTSKTIDGLKKQMPFDSALLSRFHLVYVIRRPDVNQFKEISNKIVKDKSRKLTKDDNDFIKAYIEFCKKIKVKLPSDHEKDIVEFVGDIKKNEKKYLIDISPRLVFGFVRMAKASAKLEMRSVVEDQDIALVKNIVKSSFEYSS
jgi:replicative DNA helicase Mcm